MIALKQIFHEVSPKTKSRQKVVHDVKKVEKHWYDAQFNIFPLNSILLKIPTLQTTATPNVAHVPT